MGECHAAVAHNGGKIQSVRINVNENKMLWQLCSSIQSMSSCALELCSLKWCQWNCTGP